MTTKVEKLLDQLQEKLVDKNTWIDDYGGELNIDGMIHQKDLKHIEEFFVEYKKIGESYDC